MSTNLTNSDSAPDSNLHLPNFDLIHQGTKTCKKEGGIVMCLKNVIKLKIVSVNDNEFVPFLLTSLIYAGKFEFENLAIMEEKQCEQNERFSAMAKKEIIFVVRRLI